jgi:putative membrane protein
LFVLSRPAPVFLWALPSRMRRGIRTVLHGSGAKGLWRRSTDITTASLLHAAAIWLWHLPGLFEQALFSEAVHALQHISFLGTALLFWWAVLSREARRRAPVAGALSLFATSVHTSLLGALLTFSHGLWYPGAGDPWPICGVTPMEDQQLAGLVMWVPGGLSYLFAALWLIGRHLLPSDPDQTHAPARV